MAIEKVIGKASADFGACVLFSDDVAAFVEILRTAAARPNARITFTAPGFRGDASDFEELPENPKELSIVLHVSDPSPNFALYFWERLGATGTAPDTPIGRDALAQVKKYVRAHCQHGLRRWGTSKLGVLLLALFPSVIVDVMVTTFLPKSVREHALAISMACSLFTCFFVMAMLFLNSGCKIYLTKRAEHPESFWKRNGNGDKIITGVVIGTIMLFIGLLVGRATKKDAPAPAATAVLPSPEASTLPDSASLDSGGE